MWKPATRTITGTNDGQSSFSPIDVDTPVPDNFAQFLLETEDVLAPRL